MYLCYLLKPLFHFIRNPVIEKCVLLIIFLHLLGPNRLVPVFQFFQHLAEKVFTQLLCHKHHQPLRKHWHVMVDKSISCIWKTVGAQTCHLYCKMLHVKKLPTLHEVGNIEFDAGQILFIKANSLSINDCFVWLLS